MIQDAIVICIPFQKSKSMYSGLLIACCLMVSATATPESLPWQDLMDPSRDEGNEESHTIKFHSSEELDDEWQAFKINYGNFIQFYK